MRTFENTTILTAQAARGQRASVSLRCSYTYALTLRTFGVYLYLCLDRGWCQVR